MRRKCADSHTGKHTPAMHMGSSKSEVQLCREMLLTQSEINRVSNRNWD